MKQRASDFRSVPVYDWDAEPKDERPSEFVPSTGYSSLSGYYSMPDRMGYPVGKRRRAMPTTLLAAGALSIMIGAAGLFGMVHFLRG